jgi:hypothetical protein
MVLLTITILNEFLDRWIERTEQSVAARASTDLINI